CRYCSNDCGDGEGTITLKTVEALLDRLPEALDEGEAVNVLWHGGEPTLLPAALFEEVQLAFAAKLESKGHPIKTMIQTNGLDVSAEWRDCLLRFDVAPGVSLDGPQFLHDSIRRTRDGASSYERVVQNVREMADAGLAVSLLCVVREEHVLNVPATAQWAEELGLPVRFNPLFACGRGTEALPRRAYFQFLRDIFALFSESSVDIRIEPLAWMLEGLLWGRAATECSFNGACGRSILTLFPDGGIGPCGRSGIRYGNILTSSLSELLCGEERLALIGRGKRLDGLCGRCSVRAWCNGGCPAIEGETPDAEFCSARRDFFAWLSTEGTLLFQQSLLREKRRLKNELDVWIAAREELAKNRRGSADV
ncbi:MAG: radical SAM protein, partial [Synergistaceae bacterium]|nr:radical SAM protein [Synergistaceae bacterium]